MSTFFLGGLAAAGGHFKNPFANLLAFHDYFPFTLFANVSSHKSNLAK
jgi:hypothetical protein